MLPGLDTSIRPPAAVEAPGGTSPVTASGSALNQLAQLVIGKPIQAEVLARLNDGSFVVRLDGATARMSLPSDVKAGDSLPMTLLSTSPRPTFSVETSQGRSTATANFSRQDVVDNMLQESAGDEALATAGGNKPDPAAIYLAGSRQSNTEAVANRPAVVPVSGQPAAALPASVPNSAPTNLSSAGRLIDQILHTAQQQGTSTALVAKLPLAESAEALAHPEQFAKTLQQNLNSSGLFYESHVADWASGKLAMGELSREPQAQVLNEPGNANGLTPDNLAKHPELAQIINQQLDTLEQQRVTWQGNLLPGQAMQWEIKRDDQARKQATAETEESWQSVVRFELPHLGNVAATINLHGTQLHIFVRTSNEDAATALQDHAQELASALKQAGTSLDAFSVKQDDAST